MTDMFEPAEEAETPAIDTPATEAPADAAPIDTPAPKEPEPKAPEAKDPKWFRDAIKAREDRARAAERERDELRARTERAAPAPESLTPQAMFERQQVAFNISISERFARREHGALFDEAKVWLETRPDIEAWATQQPDPWESAISLYRREKMAEEIGDDPESWREKERAKIRDQLLAEMGEPGAGEMTAAPVPRLPQSAASVRSAAPRGPIEKKSPFTHKFG